MYTFKICVPLLGLMVIPPGCARYESGKETSIPSLGLKADRAHRPARVAGREVGRRAFHRLCTACHGSEGRAQTPLAADLNPWPRDLTGCNFKYRSTASGVLPTDEDLLRTLQVGLPGTAMPSFGALMGSAVLRAVVRQVKQRCQRFAEEQPETPLHPPGRAFYSADSVARGSRIYRREGCHKCHGDQGRGDGLAAGTLRDNRGRPIEPRDYTRGVFRSGFHRKDIYRAFSTGLDGTPMPALPETVNEPDRWDLTHYIVSLSHDRSRLLRVLERAPTWYEPVSSWSLPWQ